MNAKPLKIREAKICCVLLSVKSPILYNAHKSFLTVLLLMSLVTIWCCKSCRACSASPPRSQASFPPRPWQAPLRSLEFALFARNPLPWLLIWLPPSQPSMSTEISPFEEGVPATLSKVGFLSFSLSQHPF